MDSKHVQLAIYTVFHEESESAVRIDEFLDPEEKIKKNRPTRVSISYRKISYRMSPPYAQTPIFLEKKLDPGIGVSYFSLLALKFDILPSQIRIPHEKLYI